jgi:integrase
MKNTHPALPVEAVRSTPSQTRSGLHVVTHTPFLPLPAARAARAREADLLRYLSMDADSQLTFRGYAEHWLPRYRGRGRNDCSEITKRDYRRDLEIYAYPWLGAVPLAHLTPRDLTAFVAWLCDPAAQGRALSDRRIRNVVTPVRACLATAAEEGFVRANPALRLRLPLRPRIQEEDRVKVFTREELVAVIAALPSDWRVPFQLLAVTGLRFSEWIALGPQHLALETAKPHVKVRRRLYRGQWGPPKSRHGHRDVPLTRELAADLTRWRAKHRGGSHAGQRIALASDRGAALNYSNLRQRVLMPALRAAGRPDACFHCFRHTCASMLFARGATAVQVQHWLGHHSPAFTLDTYIHLIGNDLGPGLELV